jgi:hypothetical protein
MLFAKGSERNLRGGSLGINKNLHTGARTSQKKPWRHEIDQNCSRAGPILESKMWKSGVLPAVWNGGGGGGEGAVGQHGQASTVLKREKVLEM